MKRLIPLLILAVIGTSPSVYADDEVTPLQLKVMQTRKFLKPIVEVAKASKEDGESMGAYNCSSPLLIIQRKERPIDTSVTCRFMPKTHIFTTGSGDLFKITYELSSSADDRETTVRIKILTNARDPKQVTDTEAYAQRFKSIGDLIFIEGIPLTPPVQN
jgi:hypothetical protein